MNLNQAIIRKSLKRVDSDCFFIGVLDFAVLNNVSFLFCSTPIAVQKASQLRQIKFAFRIPAFSLFCNPTFKKTVVTPTNR